MQSYWDSLRSYVDTSIAPLLSPAFVAPAARAPSPAPPPFPPLPSELVLRILAYTLPVPSCSTHRARTRLHRAYSLFSRDCARWATLELRRDVRLQTFAHARWFAQEVRVKRWAWAQGVRVLRLGSAGDRTAQGDGMWRERGAGRLVRELLRLCEGVEELWMSGLSGLEPGDLAPGRNLRRLWLNETRVTPSPDGSAPLRLEQLSTLYLKAVIFTGHSLAQLLDTAALPALQHVEYHSVHQSLVNPVAPPAAAAAAATLPPGGASNLAAITANLAALSPATSSHTSAPSHPLLAFAPQLTTLVLGAHAARSLPPPTLLALLARADTLAGVRLPAALLLDAPSLADALAACSALRALRLEGKERPRRAALPALVPTWRSAAFDLVTQAMPRANAAGPVAPGDAHAAAGGAAQASASAHPATDAAPSADEERERRRVEAAVQAALGVFAQLPAARAAEKRTLTIPAGGSCEDSETTASTAVQADAADVSIEQEPEEEESDGPWRLGGERWRERRGLQ
ncbi:hypothetical protein JCM10450v2_006872 [Rhodotorula kratochvilovae]